MTLHPASARQHTQWSVLTNSLVEIRHSGRLIRTGTVEDVMPDSSALWIAADLTHPRQMFEVAQGHQVWIRPRELSGDLTYRMTVKHIFGGIGQRDGLTMGS
jgi:hypothetical protein